eukprot:comp23301_c3_seq1/m.38259 comp23301_c3_seq1/g.38259  ORF comp23301_c3_seq1/g.38259 comp23301_c3_seq1/m.38259 type:complete len:261 (-) comp23301_c3_seq1:771-1553(-)
MAAKMMKTALACTHLTLVCASASQQTTQTQPRAAQDTSTTPATAATVVVERKFAGNNCPLWSNINTDVSRFGTRTFLSNVYKLNTCEVVYYPATVGGSLEPIGRMHTANTTHLTVSYFQNGKGSCQVGAGVNVNTTTTPLDKCLYGTGALAGVYSYILKAENWTYTDKSAMKGELRLNSADNNIIYTQCPDLADATKRSHTTTWVYQLNTCIKLESVKETYNETTQKTEKNRCKYTVSRTALGPEHERVVIFTGYTAVFR